MKLFPAFIIDKVDRDIEEKKYQKKKYLPLVSDDKKKILK